MKIAIISDELSYDFHTAVELGAEWGVRDFEIRCLGPERVPDHAPVWTDIVIQYVTAGKVNITAMSPGLFKLKRSDPATATHAGERLDHVLDLAQKWNCPRIIVFAFLCEPGDDPLHAPDAVVDILRRAADKAADVGVEVVIETSQNTFAATGRGHRALLDRLDHPNVKTNWDPANALNGGDTSPLNGYSDVAGTVAQVHVKDFDGAGKIVTVGTGKMDWPGQFAALAADGFDGLLTLETHIQPRLTGTKACLDALRKLARPWITAS
ncbi:MAG: sugar phosphate isomerase/epimerase family protein [Planctomycetota bacterium]